MLMHRHQIEGFAVRAEGVEIAMPFATPADELDPQLEAALGLAQEFGLVDAERLVEQADRGNGRFADSDGADLVRLDQRDGQAAGAGMGQRRRRHPPGRATPNDQNGSNRVGHIRHRPHPLRGAWANPHRCRILCVPRTMQRFAFPWPD